MIAFPAPSKNLLAATQGWAMTLPKGQTDLKSISAGRHARRVRVEAAAEADDGFACRLVRASTA
jgi:hypothetical protein